jgi:hypothetical protein
MKIKTEIIALVLGALLLSFAPPLSNEVRVIPAKINKAAIIKWKQVEIDLGNIEQNKPVNIGFEFTNTGNAVVVISSVQAGCGCTSVNYSKEPIAPGASASINATFNAATVGVFRKTVTVITSAEATPRILTFKGTVI